MKKTIMEQTVLFIRIIKWAILSILVGIVVGLASTIFLKTLGWSSAYMEAHPYYFLVLPLALFLSSLMIQYLAPDAEGHGTEKVIEAVHKRWGKIEIKVVPVKLVATVITLAGGGSAGKEGPCAQIGAGIASGLADLMKLTKEDRKKLVICGISAGFATVFGTPIAGALFAVEVLVLGKILQDVLFPSLVAAIIAFQISSSLGITYFHQTIHMAQFSNIMFVEVLLSGLFFGLVALLLVETLKLAEHYAKKILIWKPFKGLIGGSLMVSLAFLASPLYLGLGVNTIETAIKGGQVPAWGFLGKIVFTSITLSMGGSGGILTPVFFIGSTAGSMFAHLFHLNPAVFAAIGMVALLAGAANTPIAASVMAIEIFGPQIGSMAAIACVVSFIAAGHRSVYSSQILGITKSPSISAPLMSEFHNISRVDIKNKPGKIIFYLNKILFRDNEIKRDNK
jgi:H+/Cl- antiporter ClcA